MKLGFIGLGRMGLNMVFNLVDNKHQVVAYNRSPNPITEAANHGAIPAHSLQELIDKLPSPKIVWIMIKSGQPVDDMIAQLVPLLQKGDIIIDGGNSYFENSKRRYAELKKKGIHFLDCGTSGGMEGARHGACMMIGGDKEIFQKVEVLFKDMCVKEGYGYMGSAGAGHFVKMVHNGIEYGMMQAIAEGMQAVKNASFGTDVKTAINVYAHGSIVQSRLVDWLKEAYEEGLVDKVEGTVPKGETEEEMEKLEGLAQMPVLHTARMMRVQTRNKPSYAGKLLAAMLFKFGGHKVVEKK